MKSANKQKEENFYGMTQALVVVMIATYGQSMDLNSLLLVDIKAHIIES